MLTSTGSSAREGVATMPTAMAASSSIQVTSLLVTGPS